MLGRKQSFSYISITFFQLGKLLSDVVKRMQIFWLHLAELIDYVQKNHKVTLTTQP